MCIGKEHFAIVILTFKGWKTVNIFDFEGKRLISRWAHICKAQVKWFILFFSSSSLALLHMQFHSTRIGQWTSYIRLLDCSQAATIRNCMLSFCSALSLRHRMSHSYKKNRLNSLEGKERKMQQSRTAKKKRIEKGRCVLASNNQSINLFFRLAYYGFKITVF